MASSLSNSPILKTIELYEKKDPSKKFMEKCFNSWY